MYFLVHDISQGRPTLRVRQFYSVKKWRPTSVLLAVVCFLYLNLVVSANQYDWKNTVPKRKYFSAAPVYKPGTLIQGGRQVHPHHHNTHNNLHHHQHHQHIQRFLSTGTSAPDARFSRSLTNPTALPLSSWYSSRSSNDIDPRVGFFYADSTASSPLSSSTSHSSSLLPLASTTLQTLEPSPRSLSSLPLASTLIPSFDTNSSSNGNSTVTVSTSLPNMTNSKKKKKKKANKEQIGAKAASTITASSTAIATPPSMNLHADTSRTFILAPLMAYLFPVFLAQLFGMGMIPAAAFITLPIFLLPIGLAAAVFLI